jgi:hypothetical protein
MLNKHTIVQELFSVTSKAYSQLCVNKKKEVCTETTISMCLETVHVSQCQNLNQAGHLWLQKIHSSSSITVADFFLAKDLLKAFLKAQMNIVAVYL